MFGEICVCVASMVAQAYKMFLPVYRYRGREKDTRYNKFQSRRFNQKKNLSGKKTAKYVWQTRHTL